MTVDELRLHLNTTYGRGPWPKAFPVDCETYANVCHEIFLREQKEVSFGQHFRVLFKGVELIPVDNRPLGHELLDLITLMPDSQTQEILDYIVELRAIRAAHAGGKA